MPTRLTTIFDMQHLLWALSTDPTTFSVVGKVAYNILLVIIGINALIIVHEFGHFAVARACGVRCDKFYIWFDFWGLRFFKFQWGQTEYGLGVFPLGGYVKMLGQEDNPSELKGKGIGSTNEPANEPQDFPPNPNEAVAQSASEADAANTNLAIIPPDSFLAKSVPQRMAIIVAGVVMNFLFAIVCGTAAYLVGVKDVAPMVGNLIPGSPAWQADLHVGDKITAIDGTPIRWFNDIQNAMIGGENGVKLSIDRPGVGNIEKTVIPRKRKNDLAPSMGVSPLQTLDMGSEKNPVQDWAKRFYSKKTLDSLKKSNLRLMEADGKPVDSYAGFSRLQLQNIDRPLPCVFASKDTPNDKIDVEIPAVPMREIGVRFGMGPITMVRSDSDAAKQGIEIGDVIQSVDGSTEVDPMKLTQLILRRQNEGKKSIEIVVKKKDGTVKTATVGLSTETIIPHFAALSMKDPIGSTALGLAWDTLPIVAGVEKDSPAATLNIPIGAKVESVKFMNGIELYRTTFCSTDKDGFTFHSIGDKINLPYILELLLQGAPQKPKKSDAEKKSDDSFEPIAVVRLELSGPDGAAKKPFDIPVFDSKDWFNTDRGLGFTAEMATVKIENFGEALSLGTGKMVEYSLSVFKFLKRLGGEVSPRALGGPVTIVRVAYMFVDKGFGSYLLFLCLIGANLAVINILPIPVLDGGHLLFLAYEGIFRKPPNENVLIILSYLGLALLLFVMIWAFSLDLGFVKRL